MGVASCKCLTWPFNWWVERCCCFWYPPSISTCINLTWHLLVDCYCLVQNSTEWKRKANAISHTATASSSSLGEQMAKTPRQHQHRNHHRNNRVEGRWRNKKQKKTRNNHLKFNWFISSINCRSNSTISFVLFCFNQPVYSSSRTGRLFTGRVATRTPTPVQTRLELAARPITAKNYLHGHPGQSKFSLFSVQHQIYGLWYSPEPAVKEKKVTKIHGRILHTHGHLPGFRHLGAAYSRCDCRWRPGARELLPGLHLRRDLRAGLEHLCMWFKSP